VTKYHPQTAVQANPNMINIPTRRVCSTPVWGGRGLKKTKTTNPALKMSPNGKPIRQTYFPRNLYIPGLMLLLLMPSPRFFHGAALSAFRLPPRSIFSWFLLPGDIKHHCAKKVKRERGHFKIFWDKNTGQAKKLQKFFAANLTITISCYLKMPFPFFKYFSCHLHLFAG
jgi:hypothetical protein